MKMKTAGNERLGSTNLLGRENFKSCRKVVKGLRTGILKSRLDRIGGV